MDDDVPYDKRGKVIPTVVSLAECPRLLKAIASELNVPDPDRESAKAALQEGEHEATDGDRPAG